ncbi:enhanced serine sensitivity protein SseB C-terminal domain-containing protein [Enterococcus faecalis]|uniref:enhanced serine sensitivity protein SseB C-terminal domain-containing protein n=1 Tax=Enterococcus faecalis TaxID=1351 RepID=UPI00076FBBC7|nr:enhanced serine sensitivity protein SseB C-terminal domain-containing protein [Enterococcus faecalis]
MTLFNFKRKKKSPSPFFDFPRNDIGFQKVVDWLKNAEQLIIELDSEGKITLFSTKEGQIYLNMYTDINQSLVSDKAAKNFATVNYPTIIQIVNEQLDLDFIWLNPHSDSVQLNRVVFSSAYTIKKDTPVQIGLPNHPPKELIDFLIKVGVNDDTIQRIYLALMRNNEEFSFVVKMDSPNAKSIVQSIGPNISQLCKEYQMSYPVDFFYNDMISEDKYLIYSK